MSSDEQLPHNLSRKLWSMCYYPDLDPDSWAEKFRQEKDVHLGKYTYQQVYAVSEEKCADQEVLHKLLEWVVDDVGVTRECVACGYRWDSEDFIEEPTYRSQCFECDKAAPVQITGINNLKQAMGDTS